MEKQNNKTFEERCQIVRRTAIKPTDSYKERLRKQLERYK